MQIIIENLDGLIQQPQEKKISIIWNGHEMA